MRVTDRLRRAGAVAAMAVVIAGGGVGACATRPEHLRSARTHRPPRPRDLPCAAVP